MNYNKPIYILLISACFQFSCKKYLDIDPPKSSLVQETVFRSDDQATSSITGIYATMANSGYASGNSSSITCLSGLSSDELVGYNTDNLKFYENQIAPESSMLQSLYSGSYQSIYAANAVLEGLAGPNNGVTPPVKAQLTGEALFIRAFAYFYLVNLFGSIPLQLTTDYRVTQIASQKPVAQIYEQIILDLKAAELVISDSYITPGRVRPNKSTVQAMLARTYLYMQDWENAEKYSSLVIAKTNTYSLVNIDAIFLANSQEAIWQLNPAPNANSRDGNLFILTSTPLFVSLRNTFALTAFEPNDKRQTSWVKSYTNNTGTYYFPYKYKVQSSTIVTEYSMVLRLAEQYLIRAEARINQGKIDLGISDLNLIRNRARPIPTSITPNPLPGLITTLNKAEALSAVEQERKVELFSEWGHRWFDLKRTGRTGSVLSQIKSQWQSTDELYPIPSLELNRNSNIIQNQGY